MKCKYKKFLKAAYINYEEDYCGRGSGTFTKPTVTTPIIVITGSTAIIACAINGATIYYTLDGSTPTSSSTEYTGAITLILSCTVKAIAIKPGMSDSEVASERYVHYITQWKISGNSEVHTDPYLTSWKVSGNSVVDNNTILSCGDLGQDGKYHVKISNGVTVYDIPLTEPLRKVNDIADTIEFDNDIATVTRYLKSINLGSITTWNARNTIKDGVFSTTAILDRKYAYDIVGLCANYTQEPCIYSAELMANATDKTFCFYFSSNGSGTSIYIYDSDYATSTVAQFTLAMDGVELIYELATPTTELIDVSPFTVSPTDTYTSANVVPYSAFEHTENKEIWSCGEYNATDGKYHILVQPLGGSMTDIALTEPLRKVNDIADSIEFPSDTEGKALVTRNLCMIDLGAMTDIPYSAMTTKTNKLRWKFNVSNIKYVSASTLSNILSPNYDTKTVTDLNNCKEGISSGQNGIWVYDEDFTQATSSEVKIACSGVIVLFEYNTPTTELVDAPQIAEADSYSMVISQGGKVVEWSSFETE